VLFERFFGQRKQVISPGDALLVGMRRVPLLVVRHPRARRYVLRLRADGTARVTIPRGGSAAEARAFAARHAAWLERQLDRLQAQPRHPAVWGVGTEILFRGESSRIELGTETERGWLRIDGERLRVGECCVDLRPAVEAHLRRLAARELPGRVAELAGQHGLTVCRVVVRNQRTRWGSCSRRGTLSLNWRLVQAPVFVRDYIILHELMHLREMNHSARFWRLVEAACPDYAMAERWLKAHANLLR
jgi:predicted metal-dependent hydrolase